MSEIDAIDSLDGEVRALEGALTGAAGMAAQFNSELQKVQGSFAVSGTSASKMERTLSSGVTKAINGVVLDGAKLSDALGIVAKSMVNAAWQSAVKPVAQQMGGALMNGVGAMFGGAQLFANGGSFTQGRVMPFADGGVINGPTTFPMRNGTGLMGEAGPEAIMPLTRGADGKLGVRAQGNAQPVTVVMNINTPDAQSFQRSQSQIAARMSQALNRGSRNR